MKDLPHHMKKLNRRVIRSEHREMELESVEELNQSIQAPQNERPKEQMRKMAKVEMRNETRGFTQPTPTGEDRNREMKHRVPIFDRSSHIRPKQGAKPKKKAPPL